MKIKKVQLLISLSISLFGLKLIAQEVLVSEYYHAPGIGLNDNNVLAFDELGRAWFGTRNKGCLLLDPATQQWTIYNSSAISVLPSDSVSSVKPIGNNRIWVGTSMGAVLLNCSNGICGAENLIATPDLPAPVVLDILPEQNAVWFGTSSGLARKDNSSGNWTYFNFSPSNFVKKLLRDNNGNIWVGTSNGLHMSSDNGNTWTLFNETTTNNELATSNISDLEFDDWSRVWVSTRINSQRDSVSYYENGLFKRFNIRDFGYSCSALDVNPSRVNFAKDTAGVVNFRFSIRYNDLTNLNSPSYFRFSEIVAIKKCEAEVIKWPLNLDFLTTSTINGILLEVNPLNNNTWLSAVRGSSENTVCHYTFPIDELLRSTYTELPCLYEYLDVNKVSAGISANADMHWDFNNLAQYEVPKGSGKHSNFATALWLGGIDDGGNLRLAAQTYRQTGSDFFPGPLAEADTTTWISQFYFDKPFKVNRYDIEQFRFNFENNTSYFESYCNTNIPLAILQWPAKGNGIVTGNLAPFVDVDGNGLYNPITGGDYPDILGDQMLFKVFNDSIAVHSETGGLPLGVELHTSAYAYNCDTALTTNKVLNHTTFYKTKVINRSNRNYSDFYFGWWDDCDLGNYLDDYVICDVSRSAGTVYNGDSIDDTAVGYGLYPPKNSLKILRGALLPSNNADGNGDPTVDPRAYNGFGFGDGIPDNERLGMSKFVYYNNDFSITGNPEDAQDIYNYLRGRWKDGTHMVYGGNGYGTGTLTNYFFPGDSDPLGVGQMIQNESTGAFSPALPQEPWNELTEGNVPADRRFMMSSGPYTLLAGDTLEFDYAFIYSRDSIGQVGHLDFTQSNADLDLVQAWFDANSIPGCTQYPIGIAPAPHKQPILQVFPNPTQNILNISCEGAVVNGKQYELISMFGQLVQTGTIVNEQIDVSNLTPQVYLLRVQFNEFSLTHRIVCAFESN